MRVGFSKVEITPPLGTPCSLGVDDELVEVWDETWVRALCFLGRDSAPVFLLFADVIGFSWEDRADVTAQLSNRLGCTDFELVLHSVHQHQAPNVRWHMFSELREYGLNAVSREYYGFFVGAAAQAAERALADAADCVGMGFGEAPVSGIQSNRRLVGDDGEIVMRYSRPPEELKSEPEGHIDPLVRTLVFRRSGKGNVCWVNYHGHPTATGGDEGPWSTGDFPGQALRLLERDVEDTSFIYGTGPHGNLNPGKYVTGAKNDNEAKLRDRDRMGRILAEGAVSALERSDDLGILEPRFRRERLLVPRKAGGASAEEADAQFRDGIAEASAAHARGERVSGGGSIRGAMHRRSVHRRLVDGRVPLYVSVLGLGTGAVVFFPGEIFLESGEQVRASCAGRPLLDLSLCDISSGYIPTPDVYDAGGYELSASHVSAEAFGCCVASACRLLEQTSNG